MSSYQSSAGRIPFGTDVDAAIRHWGGYINFPDGFTQVHRVLAVLEPFLGPVVSVYSLGADGYAAVRLEAMPSKNALTTGVGFVFIRPAALQAVSDADVDLRQLLRNAKLDVHDGAEVGITIWNAQGRPNVEHGVKTKPPKKLCPSCFLQWFGDTCPDCEVSLT